MKFNSTAKILNLLLAAALFSTAVFAQTSKLSGRWNLIELKSNGEAIDLNVKTRGDKTPGINFADENRFGLITTCNGMGADYIADAKGNFKAGPIIGTKMFCGEESMKIENAMANAAQNAAKYSIDNGILVLRDEKGANVLKFSRAGKPAQSNSEEALIYIAPKKFKCAGAAANDCFRAKFDAGADWQMFCDTIQGFEFKKGFNYILKVRRTRIENPPMGASGFRWELIELVKQTRKFTKA